MKLQIDTSAKTIKLEESAKIPELLSVIKKLLPNDWKDYTLETMTVINNWTNPIVWPSAIPYIPTWEITCSTSPDGVYNVETHCN